MRYLKKYFIMMFSLKFKYFRISKYFLNSKELKEILAVIHWKDFQSCFLENSLHPNRTLLKPNLTLISIDFFKPKQKFVLVPWSPLCVRKHRWFLGAKNHPPRFYLYVSYSNCFWVEVNDASPIRVEEEEGRNGVIIVKVHQRVIWHASKATSSLKRDFFPLL